MPGASSRPDGLEACTIRTAADAGTCNSDTGKGGMCGHLTIDRLRRFRVLPAQAPQGPQGHHLALSGMRLVRGHEIHVQPGSLRAPEPWLSVLVRFLALQCDRGFSVSPQEAGIASAGPLCTSETMGHVLFHPVTSYRLSNKSFVRTLPPNVANESLHPSEVKTSTTPAKIAKLLHTQRPYT